MPAAAGIILVQMLPPLKNAAPGKHLVCRSVNTPLGDITTLALQPLLAILPLKPATGEIM